MNVISKIEVCKRNKERVNLFINEEFAFSLSAELVYKHKLQPKQEVDVEKIKILALEDSLIKCKNTSLKIIERSYKTEKEMVEKLLSKEYEKDIVVETIKFLKEYNFIDDKKYAKMYINDKVKKEGKNKIKYALLRKGVKEDVVLELLDTIEDDKVVEIATELAIKKLRVLEKRENDKRILSQKLYRFLMSKGYNYDLVSAVTKDVVKGEE